MPPAGGDGVGGGDGGGSGTTRAARLRAELEQALVSALVFNTLYQYYCDARLLVLFIRASQILRLLYFPYEPPRAQRATALLLLLSNVPVVLIHAAIAADGRPGEMLLINFVAAEPHPLPKMFYVDAVTVLLQAVLASVSAGDGVVVSVMPTLCVEEAAADELTAPAAEAAAAPEDAGEAAVERTETEEATGRAQSEGATGREEPVGEAGAGAASATGVEEAAESEALDVPLLPPAR
jgi:hypothetical protein